MPDPETTHIIIAVVIAFFAGAIAAACLEDNGK